MISPVSFYNSPASYYMDRAGTGRQGMGPVPAGWGRPSDPAGRAVWGEGRRVDGQGGADDGECQTCKSRKYKDGSNDPGVSFKTATHLDPETASYAIRAHEGEHVAHAWADAARNDKEIISVRHLSHRYLPGMRQNLYVRRDDADGDPFCAGDL